MADAESVLPDTSGNDEEKSDEQIWDELAKEDTAGPPDDGPAEPVTEPPADEPADQATGEKPVEAPKTPAPAETPAKPKEPDPWADAPENLRTAHNTALRERDEAIEKERRGAASMPAQTRKINELITERDSLKAELGNRPAAPDDDDDGGQTDEDPDLVQARADYPEVVGPLEKSNDQLRAELRDFKSEVTKRFATQDEQDHATHLKTEAARLAEKHPDWIEVRESSEFIDWAQTQPLMVQTTISDSTDAAEMSLVLSLFKQRDAEPNPSGDPDPPPDPNETAAAAEKRRLQLDSASTPKAKGPPQITGGMPEDDEGIWKHYAEKDKREAARKS